MTRKEKKYISGKSTNLLEQKYPDPRYVPDPFVIIRPSPLSVSRNSTGYSHTISFQ